MIRSASIGLVGLLLTSCAALAQTTSPPANKPETNCAAPSAGTTGSATQSGSNSDNSMAMEKSAILPSAGNHGESAAPTVQKDGKAMEARSDCPPETKPKS